MTLAIAVQYPYGKLARAFQSFAQVGTMQYPQAIIFISDSRWSYENPIMYEDIGAKIWDINRNIVVSYAGDVIAGELCIEEFKKRANNVNVRLSNASNMFQYIYKRQKKSEPRTKRLLLLLGSYSRNKGAKLFYLESPDFRSKEITGVQGIGNKDAWNAVMEEVEPKINDLSIYEGKEKDYFTLATHFISTMHRLAIQNASYNDIGGPIQCRILDCNGNYAPQISFTSDPTGKTDKWHRVTATSDEVTSYLKRWDSEAKYLSGRYFSLYSYCD